MQVQLQCTAFQKPRGIKVYGTGVKFHLPATVPEKGIWCWSRFKLRCLSSLSHYQSTLVVSLNSPTLVVNWGRQPVWTLKWSERPIIKYTNSVNNISKKSVKLTKCGVNATSTFCRLRCYITDELNWLYDWTTKASISNVYKEGPYTCWWRKNNANN